MDAPRSTAFEIARISIRLKCSNAVIAEVANPAYRNFLCQLPESFRPDIDISIELSNMPDTEGLRMIFESGLAWTLFADGNGFLVELRPPSLSDGPLWMARSNCDISEVTVYCGHRLIGKRDGIPMVTNPITYPLDQILMMYALSRRNGAIVHAAGLVCNDRAYIFPGRSGAGKSTLSRQFLAKNDHVMLSDDRIAVRKTGAQIMAYGTPWPGDAGIALNDGAPLSGIFFIAQADSNRIEEISPELAIEKLMPVTSIPWYDREMTAAALDFCSELLSLVPSFILHCRPETAAVDLFSDFTGQHSLRFS